MSSIEGWLNHRFGVEGLGLAGQSDLHLSFVGTARPNLLGDAFTAVLEQDLPGGGVDTVRLVVPSDPALREYVGESVLARGRVLGEGSYRDAALARSAPALLLCFPSDVGYVSDRLGAILRMPPDTRPRVTVVGAEVAPHAVLGGAIQFGGDRTFYQLFPFGLLAAINDRVVAKATLSAGELPAS